MRIGIIATGGDGRAGTSTSQKMADRLVELGATVEMIYPEAAAVSIDRLSPVHDLYVLKSSSEPALCYAAALDAAGARMINPYAAASAMKDKVITAKMLQSAGVPVPEAFIAAGASQLAEAVDSGPLVIKPYWAGSKGRGVQIVRDRRELAEVSVADGVIFAQRYHEPDGRDNKIYVIAGEVFGVSRVWPARTHEDKLGQSLEVTSELKDIAERCGRAFRVDLFGVDIIFSKGRPLVVDINSFPGFKGVADADRRLAEYIYRAAQEDVTTVVTSRQ
jgi:ribosomal protein S6--L-glutamate ligase